MKKKLLIGTLSAVMSLGFLTACNTDKINNLNTPEDVNFRPVRYNERFDNDLDRRNDMFQRDNRNTNDIRDRRVNDTAPVRDERTFDRNRNIRMDRADDMNRSFLNVDDNDVSNRIFHIDEGIRNENVKIRRGSQMGGENGNIHR